MSEKRLVHVVDDEEAIRKSASFLLKTSGYAVETWPSGVAFLRECRQAAPGCILLDVRMPQMDGLDVQAELSKRGVSMPVIVLTGHGDVAIAVRAMKQGAADFLEKPFEKASLLKALEVAFARLQDAGAASLQRDEALVRVSALTKREQDVLRGLSRGLPNKTIAFYLGISPRTVEVHRANLMTKLSVHSFSDVLRIAFTAGLGA